MTALQRLTNCEIVLKHQVQMFHKISFSHLITELYLRLCLIPTKLDQLFQISQGQTSNPQTEIPSYYKIYYTFFTINFGAINFGEKFFGEINFGEISVIHRANIHRNQVIENIRYEKFPLEHLFTEIISHQNLV